MQLSYLQVEDLIKENSTVSLPKCEGEDTIFEYVVGETGDWEHWSDRVPQYLYPDSEIPEYTGILVPNVDNVRTDFLIDTISKQSKCVLLIGEQVGIYFLCSLANFYTSGQTCDFCNTHIIYCNSICRLKSVLKHNKKFLLFVLNLIMEILWGW